MTNTTTTSRSGPSKEYEPVKKWVPHKGPAGPKYLSLLSSFTSLTPLHSLTLPSCWNPKDKSQFLDVSNANLKIAYQGLFFLLVLRNRPR
jgi:hypothetical protein